MRTREYPYLEFMFVMALIALSCCVYLAHETKVLKDRAAVAGVRLREVTADNLALRSINALLLETITRNEMTVRVAIDKRDINGKK